MNRAVRMVILTTTVCTALTLGACVTDGYYTSYGGPQVAYTSSYSYPYATPNYYASSNVYLTSYRTPVYQTVGFTPVNPYYYRVGHASFRGHPRYRARYYYRGMPYHNRFYSPRAPHARYRGYRGYRGHSGHYRVRGGFHGGGHRGGFHGGGHRGGGGHHGRR
ncbi:hypothetical protein ACJJIF_13965 [Microbulbifer sp. SSSA002]|uniref:hypothetical protein n=1 Tax=unclassified Microbulbifer TaxID=2619833 RepID=UPI00403A2E10